MRIQLNDADKVMLEQEGISFDPAVEHTEEQAFELVDKVYDAEVYHAQSADADSAARKRASELAAIADRIQSQIPEE